MLAYVLNFCREMRGYTKFELETLTEIPASEYTLFEENEKIPSIDQLEALSKVFRVPLELMTQMAKAESYLKSDLGLTININDITLIEALFNAYMAIKFRNESLSGDVLHIRKLN